MSNEIPDAYEYYGDASIAVNTRFLSATSLENYLNRQFLCRIEKVLRRDNMLSFDKKETIPVTLYLVLSARKDLEPEILRKIDGKELRVGAGIYAVLAEAFGTDSGDWRGKYVNVGAKIEKGKVALKINVPNQPTAVVPPQGSAAQRVAARVQEAPPVVDGPDDSVNPLF